MGDQLSLCDLQSGCEVCRLGSASPAESIMFGMFALPQRYGGFNMLSLPKGGILLNHRVDFDEQALHMSSGHPVRNS